MRCRAVTDLKAGFELYFSVDLFFPPFCIVHSISYFDFVIFCFSLLCILFLFILFYSLIVWYSFARSMLSFGAHLSTDVISRKIATV